MGGGGANSIWNHGLSKSRGVTILFSEKINYDISDITRDNSRRKISCKINASGQHSLNLVNVYLPNSGQERKNFICNSINIDRQKLNCVAGDFNCTLLKHLDRNPIPIRDDVGTHEFREFIEKYDLLDIWRARNLNNKRYTFQRGNSQSRIDFIFITDEYNYLTQNAKNVHFPFSDHDGVSLSLKFTEPERGGGTYEMKNSILKSELFQRTLEGFWSDWHLKKEDFKSKLEWWEQTKVKIKTLTIEVSKKLHVTDKQVKNWENTLEKLLENNTDR